MILCCGEALIDMLPDNSMGRLSFIPYPGGAVYNTAIALGRLDVPVSLFSGISTDFFGDLLRAHLGESNVDTGLLHFADRPTTLAFVTLKDGQACYVFYDENTAGRCLGVSDIPTVPAEVKAFFFGGIYLGQEPCGTTFETFMGQVHGYFVTMLDPNIRTGFIADEAAYRSRLDMMLGYADIVKLSNEDLAWIDSDAEMADWAQSWLNRDVSLIVVTRGDKGAVAFSRDAIVEVLPGQTTVADTVGAGDTFNAGLLASFQAQGLLTKTGIGDLSEDAIARALTFAAEAAAITVSRPGANPPWREELSAA